MQKWFLARIHDQLAGLRYVLLTCWLFCIKHSLEVLEIVLHKKNNASAVSNLYSLEQTQLLLGRTVLVLPYMPYFPSEELSVSQSKNQLLIICGDLKPFRPVCYIQQPQEFSVTSSWKKNKNCLKNSSKVAIYFYPKHLSKPSSILVVFKHLKSPIKTRWDFKKVETSVNA